MEQLQKKRQDILLGNIQKQEIQEKRRAEKRKKVQEEKEQLKAKQDKILAEKKEEREKARQEFLKNKKMASTGANRAEGQVDAKGGVKFELVGIPEVMLED